MTKTRSGYNRDYYTRVTKLKRQAALVEKFNSQCYYCGLEKRLTKDHVLARTNGGSDEECNIVGACFWCNNSKGKRTIEEWRLSIAKRLADWPNFTPGQIEWLKAQGFDPLTVVILKLPEVKFAFEGGNTLAQWSSKARHSREYPTDKHDKAD